MANGYTVKLEVLSREFLTLKQRVKQLENTLRSFQNANPLKLSELMNLSDHLRRSYLAVAGRGESDALTISALTKRKRAAESNILNVLVSMGWLGKRKVHRKTVFFVLREAEEALTVLA